MLDATRLLEQVALDPYLFVRDAYLQRRRNAVYDGNPPAEDDEYDEEYDGKSRPRSGARSRALRSEPGRALTPCLDARVLAQAGSLSVAAGHR